MQTFISPTQNLADLNAGAKKVSPDGVKGRPLPQVMRATYVQPTHDAPPIVGPPGTPHHPPPAQPYMTPAGRFPPAPPGPPPSVARSQSSSTGQHEVTFFALKHCCLV